jgi:hypothetical protein
MSGSNHVIVKNWFTKTPLSIPWDDKTTIKDFVRSVIRRFSEMGTVYFQTPPLILDPTNVALLSTINPQEQENNYFMPDSEAVYRPDDEVTDRVLEPATLVSAGGGRKVHRKRSRSRKSKRSKGSRRSRLSRSPRRRR